MRDEGAAQGSLRAVAAARQAPGSCRGVRVQQPWTLRCHPPAWLRRPLLCPFWGVACRAPGWPVLLSSQAVSPQAVPEASCWACWEGSCSRLPSLPASEPRLRTGPELKAMAEGPSIEAGCALGCPSAAPQPMHLKPLGRPPTQRRCLKPLSLLQLVAPDNDLSLQSTGWAGAHAQLTWTLGAGVPAGWARGNPSRQSPGACCCRWRPIRRTGPSLGGQPAHQPSSVQHCPQTSTLTAWD